jgi:hypothetical protein
LAVLSAKLCGSGGVRAVIATGRIMVRREVGGLHHRYERQAA